MISTAGTNFLKHIFSESIPDLANIVEAEATDDKETLIDYLNSVKGSIGIWIKEIKTIEEDSWQSARRAAKTLNKMNLGIMFFGNLFPYLRKRGKLGGCCKLSHRGKTPVWLYDTIGIAELINEGKLDYNPKD